jgi:hypothetical protein
MLVRLILSPLNGLLESHANKKIEEPGSWTNRILGYGECK